MKPYTLLKGKHEGQTAFICGAGPSFLDCINHPRFAEIHKHVVVSVNSSIIALPWKTCTSDNMHWVSNDSLCRWWDYWQKVKTSKATRVVRDSWKKYEKELDGFYYFWPRPTSEGICNPEDLGLSYCSSVPTSIDLCIFMGIRRIFLLGVDQRQRDGKSHFWEFLSPQEQPRRIDRGLASWQEQTNAFNYNDLAYPALKDLADIKCVEIFNCNIESCVEYFDKITFDQALEMVKYEKDGNCYSYGW